jgi:Protein of unknown function (DUF4058)
MPLRDHFRPPVSKKSSWEGFHGMWPGEIVRKLIPELPSGYVAEPRVHLGTYYEIDVCAFEREDGEEEPYYGSDHSRSTGVAAAPQVTPVPLLTLDTEFPEEYAYEVLIFDIERERQLVAAIEIVSPANKDRPASRQLFAAKCYNLLKNDVCVSIIDLVTTRNFNLYVEFLALLKQKDPKFSSNPSPLYVATCHKRQEGNRTKLDTWSTPLAIGKPLPSLPVWLSQDLSVTLNLESSYEDICQVLRVP